MLLIVENYTLLEIGKLVKEVIGEDVEMEFEDSADMRSYHISSKKIADRVNFLPKHTIKEAVSDLQQAFKRKLLKDSLENPKYFNIRTMQLLNLK